MPLKIINYFINCAYKSRSSLERKLIKQIDNFSYKYKILSYFDSVIIYSAQPVRTIKLLRTEI